MATETLQVFHGGDGKYRVRFVVNGETVFVTEAYHSQGNAERSAEAIAYRFKDPPTIQVLLAEEGDDVEAARAAAILLLQDSSGTPRDQYVSANTMYRRARLLFAHDDEMLAKLTKARNLLNST